ncbi:MAG: HemK family protein methyltransferase [Bacteriovoracaceae bacterium]|jgi:release factor glutamine methyltransferase|nr:HemK family protein methyltransferase [Bacteriovoracaceae bacterium]
MNNLSHKSKAKLDLFFEENKDLLQKNYPGLKLIRLYQELDEISDIESFKKNLLEGIPLEYISNISYFYKEAFYVDNRVLIPRSETEILVEDSINFINKNNCSDIYEIGLGSGCISLSIGLDVDRGLRITGSDICDDALKVANLNLSKFKNELSKHKVLFIKQDRINPIENKYDFIVSNPPYIKEHMNRDGVHVQTLKHEPHKALFLKDDEFDSWFKKLFCDVFVSLKPSGAFFMEGHEDSLRDLGKIANKYFSKVELKKDYTQRLRFLYAYKD